jgi:hypothetical protein
MNSHEEYELTQCMNSHDKYELFYKDYMKMALSLSHLSVNGPSRKLTG